MDTTNAQSGVWHESTRLALGRALLVAAAPLSAAELADAIGGHQSNLKKVADCMVEEGLLRRRRGRAHSKPGRTPMTYEIVGDERASVRTLLAERASPGSLQPGQQLVVASIPGSRVGDLKRVMGRVPAGSQIEWVALVDGDPQECLMTFEGDRAVDLANDLMEQLAAAEINCRRATVAQVVVGHGFVSRRSSRP